jgi:hypothetical protein
VSRWVYLWEIMSTSYALEMERLERLFRASYVHMYYGVRVSIGVNLCPVNLMRHPSLALSPLLDLITRPPHLPMASGHHHHHYHPPPP